MADYRTVAAVEADLGLTAARRALPPEPLPRHATPHEPRHLAEEVMGAHGHRKVKA